MWQAYRQPQVIWNHTSQNRKSTETCRTILSEVFSGGMGTRPHIRPVDDSVSKSHLLRKPDPLSLIPGMLLKYSRLLQRAHNSYCFDSDLLDQRRPMHEGVGIYFNWMMKKLLLKIQSLGKNFRWGKRLAVLMKFVLLKQNSWRRKVINWKRFNYLTVSYL